MSKYLKLKAMKNILLSLIILFFYKISFPQHCAPIVESYLSGISVSNGKDEINIDLKYSKLGGADKEAYQIYLIAYLEKNEDRVIKESLNDLFKDTLSAIIHSVVIKINDKRFFEYSFSIKHNIIANIIIKQAKLKGEISGGYGSYHERFKIMAFIPFLEDKKYSTKSKLPTDRHECNYTNSRSLLLQPLPYLFGIKYGTVLGKKLGKGDYFVYINGTK